MSGKPRPRSNNGMTSMARTPAMGAPVAKLINGPRKPAGATSTIASRLSSEAPRGSLHDKESFKQLLQGLLGTSGTQTSEGIVIEDDVNVNHDLINVIVEAGLGLAHDIDQDPFVLVGAVNRQIFDSLTALDLVIKKTPNVLFLERIVDSRTDKEIVAPTFAQLIPKLFPLFGKPEDPKIEGQVCKLLAFMVEAQNRCSHSRQICASVSDFLQFCADDLITSVETTHISNNHGGSNPQIFFPSDAPDISAHLKRTYLGGSFSPKAVCVGNRQQALKAILAVLDAILVRLSSQTTQILGTSIRRDVSLFLNSFGRLWKLILQRMQTREPRQNHDSDLPALSLNLLLKAYSGISSLKQKISLAQRVSLMLAQCVVDLLGSDWIDSNPSLQSSVSVPLTKVLHTSNTSLELKGAIEDLVVPVVVNQKLDNRHYVPEFQTVIDHISSSEASSFGYVRDSRVEQGIRDPTSLSNQMLAEEEREVHMLDAPQARPRKRLRLSRGEDEDAGPTFAQSLIHKVYTLLGLRRTYDLAGLSEAMSSSYEKLSIDTQCETLQLLGRIACAETGTLSGNPSGSVGLADCTCSLCEVPSVTSSKETTWDEAQSAELFETLVALLPLRGFQQCSKTRIIAMFALRRLVLHSPEQRSGISSTKYGEWCLQSLRSSVRELRIAAGRTLATFLHQGVMTAEIRRHNRIYALETLQNLLEGSEIPILETSLLALGEVAQVCGDDELNIILIRFVEYLGHENPYLSSLAYNQLLKLAQSAGDTPASLLRPFWRTIAVIVVKNLHARPQIAQQLSELLGMIIPDLLVLTEFHTLPYLVLTKNVEIVRRIAFAHRPGVTTKALLTHEDNFSAILALLLTQPSNNYEMMIMSLLNEFSSDFDDPLDKLVNKVTIRTACEILKASGDAQEGKGSKTYHALRVLANLGSSGTPKKSENVGHFFETNALGIIKEFADTISEVQIRQPLTEKRRCLKATAAMVRLGKGQIASALPQISACLRSAMGLQELCDTAFHAWSALIFALTTDDIEPLVDQTFSMVIRNWNSFAHETQDLAQQTISHIFSRHAELLGDLADSIPSLGSIPELSQFETKISQLKDGMDVRHELQAFIHRCQNDNATVVLQALTELISHLKKNQEFLHQPSINEVPDPVVAQLTRSVLDCCVKFSSDMPEIAALCTKCLGQIGCLDPNRIEATRIKKDILVLSNFGKADETIEFILFFVQEILVNAFLSAPNTRVQGFLAFAMQELLKLCELDSTVLFPSRDTQLNVKYRRWLDLPELVRNTLTPFLNSRYTLKKGNVNNTCSYPLFHGKMSQYEWLQRIVLDLLEKKNGENVGLIFDICSRIIRYQDISITTFLLPFTALNVMVSGTEKERNELIQEFLSILQFELPEDRQIRDNIISCSESIFETLDYLSRWRQENKRQFGNSKLSLAHGKSNTDLSLEVYAAQLASVDSVLNSIPAEIISKRAVECKSFSRALFHWEQYIRQQKDNARARDDPKDLDPYFERLQEIYSQIDEPDGIEGISAQLHVPDVEQQILEHQKTGRWMAAQSWYEIRLNEDPDNIETQLSLLKCLKESGQYDGIMSQIDTHDHSRPGLARLLPYAVEASWITSRWDKLEEYIRLSEASGHVDFNMRLGSALLSLRHGDMDGVPTAIRDLQLDLGKGLTVSSASSLQSCHDTLLKLHVLEDIETLLSTPSELPADRNSLQYALNRRLEVVGGYVSDKQYLLGLRRAVMQLSPAFSVDEIASAWIASAKLARKGNSPNQAVNAVLRASRLGSSEAAIENARLLWKEGHHRKATKTLDGLLATHSFSFSEMNSLGDTNDNLGSMTQNKRQKLAAAKAQLLLAKWLDQAGQTASEAITERYRDAIKLHRKWEKGHFSLGKYYNKLLDSEKSKPPNKRSDVYTGGEVVKLVIDNYLRSMPYGFKYVFRTLPKILTLWLDLASSVEQPTDLKHGNEKFELSVMTRRKKVLEQINAQIKKYLEKIPPCSLYTGLPQVVARICHSNVGVQGVLTSLIVKIVCNFPQQALWTLLAVIKSSSTERSARGAECLRKIQEFARRTKVGSNSIDLKALVASGHRLSDELLRICEADINGKPSKISLLRDLGFNHKLAPCKLVVPLETTLTPSLPPNLDQNEMATHAAFPKDTITISAFLDDVLILSSLQKPRKINLRGSDGKVYGVLCKPKDDLRKDQRLMEFNTMINRFLKRDDESSKRKLYIKTYAVTPLNEECGIIEWVDNLKTLRDILLKRYAEHNITINYVDIRNQLDEACYDKTKLHIFTDRVLAHFRPVFYEWFIEMFPEPEQWFTARLRYTRSCAVMSIVGYVLGLGDRHGENILFQEDSGGTLHVDFNCLFDKGLTFEKPELVPFRLTHNMVDAFGAYGYDGPFRRSCELSMGLLRQNEDALMTILETFLYDPTTDFIGKKKRHHANVPDTPAGVLESVRTKLRGLLPGESVPLSVGGHVDHLIRQAVEPKNLAAMYIGWCAFF